MARKLSISFVTGSLLVFIFSIVYYDADIAVSGTENGITALVVAWLFIFAGIRQKMASWLSDTLSQFLGRISYSLYLVHTVVGWRFIKLTRELYGSDFSPLLAWLAMFGGVAVSVFSAWIIYRFIESPSLRISHKIKIDRPLWN